MSQYFPEITEEFAQAECNCCVIGEHVCTWYSPELATRYETKEEALGEKWLTERGFKPVKYKIILEVVEE
jgi:hypothetical protein